MAALLRAGALVSGTLLGAVVIAGSTAQAGTVGVSGTVVEFSSATSEENRLVVSVTGAELRFADSRPISPGNGCQAVSGNEVRCALTGPMSLYLQSGAGSDTVVNDTALSAGIAGQRGDDVLTGGSGPDRIYGLGADPDVDVIDARGGNDFVDTRSRTPPDSPDRVRCGDGIDRVIADFHDHVESDCETVERAGEPLPGGAGVTDPQGNPLAPPSGPAGRTCAFDIVGTPVDDVLEGTAAGDNIYGVGGNDMLRGRAGNDCLFGGNGRDRLSGGTGSDTLRGGSGADRLVGAGGGDRLVGGRGRNRFSGGPGRDRVRAANGVRDIIRCGRGRDVARADTVDRAFGCERVRRR
jgi:Ca2+-binding RTX toxin-like protein